jgi:inward rectifier potassium channel
MLRGMPSLVPFHRASSAPGDDLGLGLKAGPRRGVNKDGSFNVRRVGAPAFRPYELYHQLIAMSLPRFIGVLLGGYLAANLLFGSLYTLIGLEHFAKASGAPLGFLDAFFFSAQTLTTVGYGHIYPIGTLASVLAAMESLVGLLAFAVATGLLYGRFSRPHARVLFSRHAVVAPFRGGRAFMFRIVNERSNQLIEVEANVTLSFLDPETGNRQFSALKLERTRINLFPSNWTLVHPMDAESPLAGLGEAELRAADAEFIVLIKAFDDTFAQTVYARSSYKAEEVAWGRRFVPMVDATKGTVAVVDLGLLDATEPAELPAAAEPSPV